MGSTRTLFIATALVKVDAGLALLGVPSVAIWLLRISLEGVAKSKAGPLQRR